MIDDIFFTKQFVNDELLEELLKREYKLTVRTKLILYFQNHLHLKRKNKHLFTGKRTIAKTITADNTQTGKMIDALIVEGLIHRTGKKHCKGRRYWHTGKEPECLVCNPGKCNEMLYAGKKKLNNYELNDESFKFFEERENKADIIRNNIIDRFKREKDSSFSSMVKATPDEIVDVWLYMLQLNGFDYEDDTASLVKNKYFNKTDDASGEKSIADYTMQDVVQGMVEYLLSKQKKKLKYLNSKDFYISNPIDYILKNHTEVNIWELPDNMNM